MPESTVKLTADVVWQDGTPFSGVLEVTLQNVGTSDNYVVAPKRQQEIQFEDGRAEIDLVPSAVIDDARYNIRLITTAAEGNYKSRTVLLDETLAIPSQDCALHDLVNLGMTPVEEPANP